MFENTENFNIFMNVVLTLIILLVIYNFQKQNITVLEYGVLGLFIYLLIELITGNCLVMHSKLCKKPTVLPLQPIVQTSTQSTINDIKDNESPVDPYRGSNPAGPSYSQGPLDGLRPEEMTSRLQYLYHATSNPSQQISYIDYKNTAVDRLEYDNASLSSYDLRMIDKTSSFYKDLSANQVNVRDCMDGGNGPGSCFQDPRSLRMLESGQSVCVGGNCSNILSDGLNEKNIGNVIREDFNCPSLMNATNGMQPLFINAPGNPTKDCNISGNGCRGCTVSTCSSCCGQYNELFS
jgi:hypothetical protein